MKPVKRISVILSSRKKEAKRPFTFRGQVGWFKINQPIVQKWGIIFLLSAILCFVISSQLPSRPYQYRVGQIASWDVKAPRDFLVEDAPATVNKQEEAEESIHPVYDFDLKSIENVETTIERGFKVMGGYFPADKPKVREAGEPAREEFEQLLGIPISEGSFAILVKKKFDPAILDHCFRLLNPFLEQSIVSKRELLASEKNRGIVVRSFPSREETLVQDLSRILDLDQVRTKIKKAARLSIPASDRNLEGPVVEMAQGMIRPNLTFNKVETEERKAAARDAVKPVLFEVKKGEIIIREGEKVSPEHLLKLGKLRELKTDQNLFGQTLGNFFTVFLILSVVFYYATAGKASVHQLWNKDLTILSLGVIFTTILIRIGTALPKPEFLFFSDDSLFYAVPVATSAIVISVVLGTRSAATFTVLIAIIATLIMDFRISYFFYPFVGSLVGARESRHCRQRSTLLKAGLWVGLANALLILTLKIRSGTLVDWEPLVGDLTMGFLSGLFSGIIATGVVPLIEVLFSYTTDIKLLELGNLNQPLLRELIVQAPGTYHHSILAGSLAENAAEAIGANPLLARVGAYYHDIGKKNKPLYFIENQKGAENRHDKLSPNMSSLILISHVKDGLEQAKERKLGKVIADIIQQHHGTSLIAYFFQKAKEKEDPLEATVDENDFRYPGPKPQTKEAGLVMLADAVEAASRTIADPTPARIQGMVQRIINGFFSDGQLDECELALKDLHLIAKSFNRMLAGIFHQRIEYPERTAHESAQQKKHETLDRESPKETKDRPKNGQEDRERDLKRLGIS
jgi:cyclic-di-AMP phosphodiesterase PgpH